MQTFLPYPVFKDSASCLDRQRLGKQRVEAVQLLRATLLPGSGWASHPAARMWRGYHEMLVIYSRAVCREWIRRGYRDGCMALVDDVLEEADRPWRTDPPSPPWLGDRAFHASHRSNLLRKDPDWYGRFGWSEPPTLPYVWPV